ncbi:hypothetical protein AVEN_254389-1 [Araneus ventricosus]|uniref:Uncharacterized protein n=1 Tax=Araneus ventricosus TaxID=182803 RepID=A0A4Y2WX54_ARAVE|nr:hypothetical protein AVEN_254389-1 [Araneus ventricosus]
MTISILLAKLKTCCKVQVGSLEPSPIQPIFGTPSGFQTLIWNEVLFKYSDVKTAAENCGRDFYQAGLNKLVLRSDKCLNRFGNYVEK